MAINYTEGVCENNKPNATINIDNGDLEAMKDVMSAYEFVDQQALIRYALVALLRADDNQLYVRDDGNIVAMKISENLVKKNDQK